MPLNENFNLISLIFFIFFISFILKIPNIGIKVSDILFFSTGRYLLDLRVKLAFLSFRKKMEKTVMST